MAKVVETVDSATNARLVEGPGPAMDADPPRPSRAPAAAVAAHLIVPAQNAGSAGLIYLAASERRADEIGRALHALAPDLEALVLPPWDCLPYDRASPSHEVMGRRMAVFDKLATSAAGARLLVASPAALMQRIPPTARCADLFNVKVGEALDRAALEAFATRAGYVLDDRIDEPGEIAFLGEVVDVFPPDAQRPVRIVLTAQDQVEAIRPYDPLSQRSLGAIEQVCLRPASELVLDDGVPREPGAEHRMAEAYGDLRTVFDLVPGAAVVIDADALDRCASFAGQIREAWTSRRTFGGAGAEPVSPPEALYLDAEALEAAIAERETVLIALDAVEAIDGFAVSNNPGRAFCDFVQAQMQAGRRVAVTGLRHEQKALVRALKRGLDIDGPAIGDWVQLLDGGPGSLLAIEADLDAGFIDGRLDLTVIAASDVLGGRAAMRKTGAAALIAEPDLRVGDVVIHEDHGLGVLQALEQIDVEGIVRDVVRLEYHGGATLLVEVSELDKVWRYGSEPSAVTLDRLHTDGWVKRRAAISAQIDETATTLVGLARARSEAIATALIPPKVDYARFAARFAFPETGDQATAIESVLKDLASGRPMNRLVCGDVGFGKTEVALRAAAAVALSGRQVALAAPTTVLARQHVKTFQRRFEGTGLRVAHLSRLVSPAEAKAVKQGLASGDIHIVVGTHAVAADDIVYADLGLVIVDEEQKFGAKLKASLHERASHILTLTATPIPRTLQGALVGVQDVSVIASPPARRRPIRTFLAAFDPAAVRTALLREKRRGGQSFLVAPRIEDIAPMAARLAEIVPELTVSTAHGNLPADQVDEVMVAFADGDGDVLLATNIVESGLDVPRANTMLIWRPDRFGLSQLHQLRGRVGRGRAQGVAYLLSDPADELSEATRARLSTLEAFDRLGSGFAISAQDLDLRGGGELVGDEQAGHMRLIGGALYHRLLERAVRIAKGEEADDRQAPILQMGATGAIPTDYVPDATVRINLYARLGRMVSPDEVDAFQEEIEDRFGPLPAPVGALLTQARLRAMAKSAGVIQLVAGPKAVALTLDDRGVAAARGSRAAQAEGVRWSEERLIYEAPGQDDQARLSAVERLLTLLAA